MRARVNGGEVKVVVWEDETLKSVVVWFSVLQNNFDKIQFTDVRIRFDSKD